MGNDAGQYFHQLGQLQAGVFFWIPKFTGTLVNRLS